MDTLLQELILKSVTLANRCLDVPFANPQPFSALLIFSRMKYSALSVIMEKIYLTGSVTSAQMDTASI